MLILDRLHFFFKISKGVITTGKVLILAIIFLQEYKGH